MRILCAVGTQGGVELIRRLAEITGPRHELFLLHVIDTGPRRELEGFLHRPGPRGRPAPPPERDRQIDAPEEAAGQAALQEARQAAEQAGFTVQVDLQRGRPEQVIVQRAREGQCQLVAIQNNEGAQGRPQIGPESVGHTARFVLDHAPCDVLLLREG